MRSDACYHVPTSPGQGVCTCVDELMWLRLLVELQARRIAQLEQTAQAHAPMILDPGDLHEIRPEVRR